MTPLTFHFHDSEVARIERDGHALDVVFSAARATRPAPGGGPEEQGYALGLRLRLTGVISCTPPQGCIGRLSGGGLAAGGLPQASILLPALPFEWSCQTEVAMVFGQGLPVAGRAAFPRVPGLLSRRAGDARARPPSANTRLAARAKVASEGTVRRLRPARSKQGWPR